MCNGAIYRVGSGWKEWIFKGDKNRIGSGKWGPPG